MSGDTPVLEFLKVTIHSRTEEMCGISEATFSIRKGGICVILLEEGREQTPFAAAAEGLMDIHSGRILFEGTCWEDMHAYGQCDRRGRIRRVFDHFGWVSNLDVKENLCLSECHHAGRGRDDVLAEAAQWCARFGVGRIPDGRPARVHPMTLRKLEWVRAFLGKPSLLILERPLARAAKGDGPLLVKAVCEAAEKGVAVMWLTDEDLVWNCGSFSAPTRYCLEGERLRAVEPEGQKTP